MLTLYRQQYGADGGVDARSAENAIGRTSLDLWDLVLRESLQNSWDARTHQTGPIKFAVDEFELSQDQTRTIMREVFQELPPHCQSTHLPKFIFDRRLRVMVICDSGTRGLGGPVRGHKSGTGERRDFVDFVRNLGRSTAKGMQGGTYGLGKGVLYKASKVGVCLIFSQTVHAGKIEARLIGVSGGDGDYDDGGYRYTGRNWWGVPGEDGIVDPLIGDDARDLAERLGMSIAEEDTTGTSIMILAPENEGYSAGVDRVQAMAAAALKWAWPHAIDFGDGPSIEFSFSADGIKLPKLDPLGTAKYREFALAYLEGRKLILDPSHEGNWQTTFTKIDSRRPQRHLGLLVHRVSHSPVSTPSELENTVALLRSPRMVVKYLPVPAQPNGVPSYGVFITAHDMDETFAKSEPVTHDDWVYKQASVGRNTANPVKIALDRIRDTFKALAVESGQASGGIGSKGSSRVSAALGKLISGFSGTGAEQQTVREPGPGTSRPRRAVVRHAREPVLGLLGGEVVAKYAFAVSGGRPEQKLRLAVSAHVVTESGGAEGSVPAEAEIPRFLGWETAQGLQGDDLAVDLPMEGEAVAVFTQPRDAAIRAQARLIEVDDAVG